MPTKVNWSKKASLNAIKSISNKIKSPVNFQIQPCNLKKESNRSSGNIFKKNVLMLNKLSSGMPSNEDTFIIEKEHIANIRTQIKTYEPSKEY